MHDYPSILEAARLGADWAWSTLYRDLAPPVLRYLRAHGAADAEDVLGTVFVHVVRKFADFEGGKEEFRAWVFTIARNQLVDAWRREARRPAFTSLDDLTECDDALSGDVENDALRRLADQRVLSVLGRLTPQQRDVLFLRVFAGLTVEQVAHVVGSRPGAVKSLQTRAFATIRREISKEAVTL